MHTLRAFLVLFAVTWIGATHAFAQVVPASSGRIVNFSVRAHSGAGDNVLISGFVLGGQNTRPLLVRAIGPGLAQYGVTGYMLDPELHIFRTATQEMTNDSWSDAPDLVETFRRLGAFELNEANGDAAVLLPLAPGAYTAHARGRNLTTGEVLLELYDAADTGDLSQSVANVSLRGEIGVSNPLMIAGFVVSAGAPKQVLVRAVGPTLASFGLQGALGNPRIRLYRGSEIIAQNDDWSAAGSDAAALEAAFARGGAFALARGTRDAAIVLTLEPGAYTAHVDDPTGGHGVVLTEIYDLEPPEAGGIAPNPDPGEGELPAVSLLVWQGRAREGMTPGGSVLVIRGGDVSAPLRVYLSKSGTITDDDIAGVPNSVLIPAGSSTVSVPVSAWNDGILEPAEVLSIALESNPAYQISGTGRAHVVIEDAGNIAGTGWKAEYFNNITQTGTPVLTRDDPTINFEWGSGSPGTGVNNDRFSARWTGFLEPPVTGVYTFTTRTDDGVRLWIDGQQLIDGWREASGEYTTTLSLNGGVRYEVRMDYLESYGSARAALYWQTLGNTRSVIPAENVFQVQVAAPMITSPREMLALTGGAFSYKITAVGGPQAYQAIDVPPGLTFNATTGTITGTPTVAGEYQVVLQATNSNGTGAEVLSLNVMSAGAAPQAERWSSAASAGLEAPLTPPTSTQTLANTFETSAPSGTAFERVRGFFIAPESGKFEFWIAASGPARLMIADSDQPADRWTRARVNTGTSVRQWFNTPEQAALPIQLVAGQRYYLEVTHRPAAGSGHLSVAWRRPSAVAGTVAETVPLWSVAQYTDRPSTVDGKALYLANLRTISGVTSPASGLVSLLHDQATHTASITLRMTGLTSAQISAYLLVGPEGQTGPLIQPLPNGQFNNFSWQLRDTGNLTVADLESAMRDGLLYVIVYSSDFPEGELRGHFGATAGSSVFVPPPAPGFTLGTPTAADAARLLVQATFGPTDDEINNVINRGYAGWLNQQFGRAKHTHLGYLDALAAQYALQDPPREISAGNRQEAWWDIVVNENDQLRQRVAFALSEILVVSDQGVLGNYPIAVAKYYDLMVDHAFGNFRDLLEEVTYSPAMGNYLSMLRNQKGDPTRGTLPDENYAREIMQLFTVGLNKLHPDGTLILDTNGVPIPTYTQENIMGLARVFTGWSYHYEAGAENFRYGDRDWRNRMKLYPEYHETGDKLLLESSVLPGGQTGTAEVGVVLDLLFNHPNTGPFISRQLIQRLVTSNPSPGYVYRVAQVFNDNGAGVRGDLQAVVAAILLDYEARSAAVASAQGYGKLREPLLRLTHLWRAFRAKADDGFPYSYRNPERDLMQAAARAPTVFNFFEPGHVHPGILAQAGLLAPEFQITNEQSLVSTTNAMRRAVFRGLGSNEWPILLNASMVEDLGANNTQMLDWLNRVMMNGQMSAEMRTMLLQTLNLLEIAKATPTEKAQSMINLITTSPEYSVQK